MLNDEEENPVSAAVSHVVVDEEENQQEQQQSEQQPMTMDECRSQNETQAQPPDVDFGKCSPDYSIFLSCLVFILEPACRNLPF